MSDNVIAAYDSQAEAFAAAREQGLFERPWLERFATAAPAGGSVLDLGCGTGAPIGDWLVAQGFRVTGVDASAAMLALARRRRPEGDWRAGDLRHLNLPERFDGIIAWHSLFHLTAAEQRAALPTILSHLKPQGAFLTTTGPRAGEVWGAVGAARVRHASLDPPEYAALLKESGMTVVEHRLDDPGCGGACVLFALRAA